MKLKLVLVLCILSATSFINAMMLSRSPGTHNVTASAGVSNTDQEIISLIQLDGIDVLKNMLKNGEINPNALILDKSILNFAVRHNRVNIVKELIEYGAQVQPADIQLAEDRGFYDIQKVLKDAQKAQEEIR